MFFDSPLKFHQRRWASLCKVLLCPVCKAEFKQKMPGQIYCSTKCQNENRPWVPGVLRVFDEFRQFVAQHDVVRGHVIQEEMWKKATAATVNIDHGNTEFRKRIAGELARVMDRFRRGYMIDTPAGAKFINPPWQPVCPVEHTYCNGTILPRSCPRRHPECVYTKGDWQAIFKLRGIHEFTLGEMRKRGPVRRIYDAVIRYGRKQGSAAPAFEPDAAPNGERGIAAENPRRQAQVAGRIPLPRASL